MRYVLLLLLLASCSMPTGLNCLTADPDKNPEMFTKKPMYDQDGVLLGHAYICVGQ